MKCGRERRRIHIWPTWILVRFLTVCVERGTVAKDEAMWSRGGYAKDYSLWWRQG